MSRSLSIAFILSLAGLAGSWRHPATAAGEHGRLVPGHRRERGSRAHQGPRVRRVRGPRAGTAGEDLTVAYITDQFKKVGLKPGNPDGTFIQKVPMVGITPTRTRSLSFRKGARSRSSKFRDDFVAWTKRVVETVGVDKSEVVFVGYGVQAPEFDWDDYKGVDLEGQDDAGARGRPAGPGPGGRDPKLDDQGSAATR